MSLKIWLPLNNNINNQGLSSETPTLMGSGITYVNGKLGKAAQFPNNCNSCIHMTGLKLQTGSWTAWIKVLGSGSGSRQCLISEGRDSYNDGVEFYTNQAGTTLYFKAHTTILSTAIALNTWYHVAGTFGNNSIKLYVNGALKASNTYTDDMTYTYSNDRFVLGKMAYSYTNTSNYFSFNGCLNDVRIYDHCLSAKEVSELAKGLVLHYRLSGVGGENLVPYTNISTPNMNSLWSVGTGSTIELTTEDGRFCYHFKTTSSSSGINSKPSNIYLTANTTYTFSYWIKASAESAFSFAKIGHFQVYNANSTATDKAHEDIVANRVYSHSTLEANKWTHVWVTFTTNSLDNSIFRLYIWYLVANADYWAYGFKLEKGSAATPWSPNPSDTEYTLMGLDDGIEYDCSGFGNNGVKRNISYDSNTARYTGSYLFNGNNSQVKGHMDTLANYLHNDFTIAFWIYDNDKSNRSIYIGNYQVDGAGNGIGIEKTAGNGFRMWWYGNPDYYPSGFTIPDQEWTHIAITKTSSEVKFYKNGALINTYTYSLPNSMLAAGTSICLGVDNMTGEGGVAFKGNMSDVRFYATALSADDVLALYNLGGSLDSNGTFHTYEYVEG